MRRAVIEELVGKQFCGHPVNGRLCLRRPGHRGGCSPERQIRKLTREERLERDLAAERVRRRAVVRSRDHLRRRVRALEERRAWAEAYPLFRLEYRARGLYRRARRYWRIAYHRAVLAPLGRWP